MTPEMLIVLAIAAVAMALFVTERLPIDQVAAAVPVALLLGGVIDLQGALSGLSNEATVTVASMLILGLGLQKTGVTRVFAGLAQRVPLRSSLGRLIFLCLVVACLSPFLSNTAVVAIFIPLFLTAADAAGERPSRYLMPLSFTAILAGTTTLIGTSSNLVVHNLAKSRGYDELSIFSIAPLGLVYLAVGLTYLFTVGRGLLPQREAALDLAGAYRRRDFAAELTVTADTTALGQRLASLDWVRRYHLIGIEPVRLWYAWPPSGTRPLRVGDRLLARGRPEAILECARVERLATAAHTVPTALEPDDSESRIVELIVSARSRLAGATLGELHFSSLYGAVVLAVQRSDTIFRHKLSRVRLEVGDLLLVQGPGAALAALAEDPSFSPVSEIAKPDPSRPGPLLGVAILAAVVVAAAIGLTSLTAAAVIGVLAMVYSRAIRLDEIYRELDWRILALLAGLLPLGIAMDETGLASWIGGGLGGTFGHLGPVVTVGCFYLITSLLTELMSNQAAAVVLTPIALSTASQLDMNPYSLVIAVMFGASASFMTPTGYQTNTLIYAPGGYRYGDFARVGAPLNIILAIVASIAIPILFP
jgi:di/tricarboxylate transporter